MVSTHSRPKAAAGDTIVVTKLDRLGRSTSQILSLYEELESRGVGLKSLDGVIDTQKRSDPFDKVKFVFMAALSEMERNLIRERTMEGRLAKGEAGKGGRPKKLSEKEEKRLLKDIAEGCSINTLSKKYGVSRATISRYKKIKPFEGFIFSFYLLKYIQTLLLPFRKVFKDDLKNKIRHRS
ncbi:recombinase family protein [Aggregatibacter segnis]|mgnify:FL=1|uniref:recombinase family protein n=1 Tax=Aggregatibacter segnis TaxID=739 RepID=UPI000D64C5D0|nr:recombinase family protein [Aggregatibacter segnis]